jgi:hypothetical protein
MGIFSSADDLSNNPLPSYYFKSNFLNKRIRRPVYSQPTPTVKQEAEASKCPHRQSAERQFLDEVASQF